MASPIQWKIEPVVLADSRGIARTNMSAFWEDPVFRRSWADDMTLQELVRLQAYKIPDDLLHRQDILRHMKAVDPGSGELVGYLRAALPIEHATTADGTPIWPEFRVEDVSEAERELIRAESDSVQFERTHTGTDDVAMRMQADILSKGVYIRFRYIAVHPDHQRKGAGEALVRRLLEKANELGVDVYLMAYEAGLPLYRKLGFQVIDQNFEVGAEDLREDDRPVYFMVYSAKKGGQPY